MKCDLGDNCQNPATWVLYWADKPDVQVCSSHYSYDDRDRQNGHHPPRLLEPSDAALLREYIEILTEDIPVCTISDPPTEKDEWDDAGHPEVKYACGICGSCSEDWLTVCETRQFLLTHPHLAWILQTT